MWKRLDSPAVVEKYRSEFGDSEVSESMSRLLFNLSTEPWAAKIWVVTSHNVLRFTAASSYTEADLYGAVLVSNVGDTFYVDYRAVGAKVVESIQCKEPDLIKTTGWSIIEHLLKSDSGTRGSV